VFKAALPCSHSFNFVSFPSALRSQEKFLFSVHSFIATFLLPPPAADVVGGPRQRAGLLHAMSHPFGVFCFACMHRAKADARFEG